MSGRVYFAKQNLRTYNTFEFYFVNSQQVHYFYYYCLTHGVFIFLLLFILYLFSRLLMNASCEK